MSSTGASAVVEASSDGIVDFTLFIGTSPGSLDWQVLALDTDYALTTIDGLEPVTRYWYYVKACDADRCAQTDVATFTSSVPSITSHAYGETDHSELLDLTSDVPVRFIIYYGPGDMTSTAVAGTSDTAIVAYMLDELREATLYNYKILGCTADDICGPTDPVVKQFTTLGIYPTLDVRVTGVGMSDATFSASADEPVTWRLQWDIDGEPYVLGTAMYGTGVTADLGASELLPGTTYIYEVQGCDAAGLCSYAYGEFTTGGNGTETGDQDGEAGNETGDGTGDEVDGGPGTSDPAGNGTSHPVAGMPELNAIIMPGVTAASLHLTSDRPVTFNVRYGTDAENLASQLSAQGVSADLSLGGLDQDTHYFVEVQGCAAECANMSISFTTLAQSAFVDGGSGGPGGIIDCSWGYDLVDGACVKQEAVEEPDLAVEPELPEDAEDAFDTFGEQLAGAVPATEPTGDFITGIAMSDDDDRWLWASVIAGIAVVGSVAYFVRKY